jgi:hypothetical protein
LALSRHCLARLSVRILSDYAEKRNYNTS